MADTPSPEQEVPPVVSGGDAGRLRKSWQQTKDIWAGSFSPSSFRADVEDVKAAGKKGWGAAKFLTVGIGLNVFRFGFHYADITLVFLGLIKYVLERIGWVDPTGPTAALFSTILLLFTALAVLNGEGLVLALLGITYVMWFNFPPDPAFLWVAVPIIVSGVILFGLPSVLSPKIIPPFLIFFYDIGAFHDLVQTFGLTVPETMSSIITLTPWWVILGLAYLDLEQYQSKAVSVLKILGWLYIIFSVLATSVPGIGFQTPLIKEFQESRAQLEAQLPKGEHPLYSQLKCLGEGKYGSLDQCVKQKQAEAKCKPLETTDLEAHKECMDIAQGKRPDEDVIGVVDEEPTSFSIEKGEEYLDKIEKDDIVPFVLSVKNPRFQRLNFDITCTYEAGKQKIEGISLSYSTEEELPEPFGFDCRAAQELPSGYGKWIVKVTAHGLTTTVKLSRHFVGDDPLKVKDNIAKDFFGSLENPAASKAAKPRGPSDPARLDFIVGQPPKNPIIKTEDPQLIATIKNIGGGELLSARAEIAMDAQQFTPGPDCKLEQRGNVFVNPSLTFGGKEKMREIRFAVCNLVMSDTYRFPKLPIPRLFISTLTYDYRITKEFSITVYQTQEPVPTTGVINP